MKLKRIKDWKDESKIHLFRIWVAGAVVLFVGWTPIGGAEDPSDAFIIQLIFMLGLFLFLANEFLVGPIGRMMFNTGKKKSRYEDHISKRILTNIVQFLFMIFLVFIIWMTISGIEILFQLIGWSNKNGKPVIGLEPITFALLFGLYYWLIRKIYFSIVNLISNIKEKKRIEKLD